MTIIQPKFSEAQVDFFKKSAQLFKANKQLILNNWKNRYFKSVEGIDEGSSVFKSMFIGIEMLVDDFITFLADGDIPGYLNANTKVAQEITAIDIPFEEFILGFHLYEASYGNLLKENGFSLVEQFVTLDMLHHYTIGKLANAYLQLKDATAFSIVKLAELRDPETGGHLERTREYAKTIAEYLALDFQFAQNIYDASPLHDIGKVGISDGILLKPRQLSYHEFSVMRDHTEIGSRTIDQIIKEYKINYGHLKMAREIAKYHHDYFDGSGYNGVSGKSIPLSARIFCIADVFDALVSKRPYKPSFSDEKSFDIITKGDGRTSPSHFDPDVMEAFVQIFPKFVKIRKKYDEMEM